MDRGLASHCFSLEAKTTFTFHFSIVNNEHCQLPMKAFDNGQNRKIKSESGCSLAMASQLLGNLEVKEMTTSSSSSSLNPPESVCLTPSLVGLIIVCVLIQECKLDIPSRIPWASSLPGWGPCEDKSMIAYWQNLVLVHRDGTMSMRSE